MTYEDEVMLAESEYAGALSNVRKALSGKPGFSTESRYGETYQRLVRLGKKPQIRKKYRG